MVLRAERVAAMIYNGLPLTTFYQCPTYSTMGVAPQHLTGLALSVAVDFLQGATCAKCPGPWMDLSTDPEEHQPADNMTPSAIVYQSL